MSESLDQKLARLKSTFEIAKTTLSRAEGSLDADIKRLQSEFKFDNEDVAKEELSKMIEDVAKMESLLETSLIELEEALNK